MTDFAPAALTPNGGMVEINIRETANGIHRRVFDIVGTGRGALAGCLDCGNTWREGAEILPPCQPPRTLEQQIGDAIDAYDDLCADGMDRETARLHAVQMIRTVVVEQLLGQKLTDVDF